VHASRQKRAIFAYCNNIRILLLFLETGGRVMDGQTQNPLLSREERAALDAAIVDICAFKPASTETATLASSRVFANPQVALVLFALVGVALIAPLAINIPL
jgi:hypothetical protein